MQIKKLAEHSSKKMLAFIILSFLALVHQSLGSAELDQLLKKHPTWSFEFTSVETIINESVSKLKALDPDLKEDVLRAQIRAEFGPETHIVKKVDDPKWSVDLPASFDAREEWKSCAHLINEVEDEGACYTDTHVVAASVAADRYCIFTEGSSKERLSAEILAGCVESCTKTAHFISRSMNYIRDKGIPTGGQYKSDKGCLPFEVRPCHHSNRSSEADVMDEAWTHHIGQDKLEPCEEMMPYDHVCPTKCSNRKYPKPLDEDRKQYKTWYHLYGIEFHVRNDIKTYGPVASSVLLYDDFFQYPEKGMYQKRNGTNFMYRRKFFKIIGWGEEDGIKYWLAVNSWDGWGPTKVFKVPRGIDYLEVEFLPAAGEYED